MHCGKKLYQCFIFFNFSIIQVLVHIHNPYSVAVVFSVCILNKHILQLCYCKYPHKSSLEATTSHPFIQTKPNSVIPSYPSANTILNFLLIYLYSPPESHIMQFHHAFSLPLIKRTSPPGPQSHSSTIYHLAS